MIQSIKRKRSMWLCMWQHSHGIGNTLCISVREPLRKLVVHGLCWVNEEHIEPAHFHQSLDACSSVIAPGFDKENAANYSACYGSPELSIHSLLDPGRTAKNATQSPNSVQSRSTQGWYWLHLRHNFNAFRIHHQGVYSVAIIIYALMSLPSKDVVNDTPQTIK